MTKSQMQFETNLLRQALKDLLHDVRNAADRAPAEGIDWTVGYLQSAARQAAAILEVK